jgi:hypothetical protein
LGGNRLPGGVDLDRVRIPACPSCGLADSALFWTPVKRSARTAYLSCPACSRSAALYDLRHNLTRPRWDSHGGVLWVLAVALVLLLLTLSLLRYGPPPEELRTALERSWQQVRSLR